MTPETLKQYAEVMRNNAILKVSGEEQEEGMDFCIEMDPSAFVRATAAPNTAAPPQELEPTAEEILFASSVPVTKYERDGNDPE